jgi:hypothetical protein
MAATLVAIFGGLLIMGSAYTPGLTVSADIVIRRIRRLPIKGEVLVVENARVEPDSIIARAMLPGPLQTIKLAEKLGIEAREMKGFTSLEPGASIEKGQVLAETKGFLGRFKTTVTSDYAGTVESLSEITGNILVREPSIPIEIAGYIQGTVADILPDEGAIIETRCSLVQGIFGVGGERDGVIRIAVSGPDKVLGAEEILDDDRGKILIGGSGMTFEAIRRAAQVGVIGIVAGGVKDTDLTQFLGYDIGVAITGQEAIPLTLMVTEGFGFLAMAQRTFDLLKRLEGQRASINGATQIRAGVIRPEIIVPLAATTSAVMTAAGSFELKAGTAIRFIREPYFGRLGTVTGLPSKLMHVESGAEVRVLSADLEDGTEVTVPRANVEIIAT